MKTTHSAARRGFFQDLRTELRSARAGAIRGTQGPQEPSPCHRCTKLAAASQISLLKELRTKIRHGWGAAKVISSPYNRGASRDRAAQELRPRPAQKQAKQGVAASTLLECAEAEHSALSSDLRSAVHEAAATPAFPLNPKPEAPPLGLYCSLSS